MKIVKVYNFLMSRMLKVCSSLEDREFCLKTANFNDLGKTLFPSQN